MHHKAHLFGLEPFTTYHVSVVAANQAGDVSSPWTPVQTLESSPSGLSNCAVEQEEGGRALLLQWSKPAGTNGEIKVRPARDARSCRGLSRYADEPGRGPRGCCGQPPFPVRVIVHDGSSRHLIVVGERRRSSQALWLL